MTLNEQGKQPERRYRVAEAEAWRGRCSEASPEGRAQASGSWQYPGEHPAPQRGPRGPWKGRKWRGRGGGGREEGEGQKQVFLKPGTPWHTLWGPHRLSVGIPEARGLSC